MPRRPPSALTGIAMTIGAVTLFTVMSAFVKAADGVPAGQAMFVRAGLGLAVVAGWLAATGALRGGLATTRPLAHVARGICGSLAMLLGFVGLRLLPLPEVTAIRFVTPVLIVLLAALVLGERIRAIRILAVGAGLLGVVVIVWPQLTGVAGPGARLGVAAILGSAFLAAFAQIFVKSMSASESTSSIVFWFSGTAMMVALATAPAAWVAPGLEEWRRPDAVEAALLIGAGVTGGVGQILLTGAYRHADAGVLAPFTYVSMLWSILIGVAFFGEVPTLHTLVGAALIIAAGVAIVWRERALSGQSATARRKVRAKGQM